MSYVEIVSPDDPFVPPPFELAIGQVDGANVVAVAGELDLHTAGELREALASLNGGRVIVDLREVMFVDSTALSVLLSAAKQRAAKQLELDLVLDRGDVRRVFEITGLSERFAFSATVEEALAR